MPIDRPISRARGLPPEPGLASFEKPGVKNEYETRCALAHRAESVSKRRAGSGRRSHRAARENSVWRSFPASAEREVPNSIQTSGEEIQNSHRSNDSVAAARRVFRGP